MGLVPRLKEKYKNEIVDKLKKQFKYKSIMQVPKLLKVSVNQRWGEAIGDKKLIDGGITEISSITGLGVLEPC